MVKIGIIGGTGCGGFSLENLNSLKGRETKKVTTIWGDPSDNLTTGTLNGVPVVLLGRHGPGHKHTPSNVPYKANIQAFKDQGCTHVIATSACGSLREEMAPGDVVILDQFIDWTTKRSSTFFDAALPPKAAETEEETKFFSKVTHIPMADPFCAHARRVLIESCRELKHAMKFHESGTMVAIEGPRFSTRAESKMFRLLGADLINMTTSPEVTLAKEAGLSYVTIATVTDYDSWRIGEEDVSVSAILEIAKGNQDKVFQLICKAVTRIAAENWDETLNQLRSCVLASQV